MRDPVSLLVKKTTSFLGYLRDYPCASRDLLTISSFMPHCEHLEHVVQYRGSLNSAVYASAPMVELGHITRTCPCIFILTTNTYNSRSALTDGPDHCAEKSRLTTTHQRSQ